MLWLLVIFLGNATLHASDDVCELRPDLCNSKRLGPRSIRKQVYRQPTSQPVPAARHPQPMVTFASYLAANASHPALAQRMNEQKAFPDPIRKTLFGYTLEVDPANAPSNLPSNLQAPSNSNPAQGPINQMQTPSPSSQPTNNWNADTLWNQR